LRAASVLGQEFDVDVLQQATGAAEAAVLDALDHAFSVRLIEERPGARVERYAFTHALIQQALYHELSAHRRRRLHLQMGNALERLRHEQPALAADLARHFLAAGDAERAITYALQAADHASSHYALPEAVRQYQIALGLLAHGTDERPTAE